MTKPSTPASVDPTLYVVPVPGGFAVLPFTEDVGRHVASAPVLTADEVLACVRDTDVSLMCDPTGGAVQWAHGRDLTPELLASAHAGRCGA